MQQYTKSLLSMVQHVDTVIQRGTGQQVAKIQEVRKNMIATLQILRDAPTHAPTHNYPRNLNFLQTIEKRIQSYAASVL